ncbi:hypothetical protein FNO01nite_10080 [Flavobacterium noncentrifugens]|uniref:hypothetical protein n=1 Tax=Flavobacterium noncentrifugens TaxID=1128970 RepID=UPI001113F682|nr:hypothetical protein [Flavobacterium noncentrifugens]GEP50336.1 hypothetical protein FNO01nite_10080 [Flavobacterium noncentrifugens]
MWKDFKVIYGKYITVRLCHNHGRIVKQMTDIASGKEIQDVLIEKDSLPKGIYYCSLHHQDVMATKKIIVH